MYRIVVYIYCAILFHLLYFPYYWAIFITAFYIILHYLQYIDKIFRISKLNLSP